MFRGVWETLLLVFGPCVCFSEVGLFTWISALCCDKAKIHLVAIGTGNLLLQSWVLVLENCFCVPSNFSPCSQYPVNLEGLDVAVQGSKI